MARAVLLDIDGVLTVSWQALPDAAETIDWLTREGIDFRLVTNTSSRSRRMIAALLEQAGMPIEAGRILTAATGAARYLRDNHPGRRCLVINHGDLEDDLEGVPLADADNAEVVLLGSAGPTVGYREIDNAFKLAEQGIPVVALQRNLRFQTSSGPALDMGAFLMGLEAAADITATVVGKPAQEFFAAALADMDVRPDDAVMVGDDLASDVVGAQAAGVCGVLVRTGKFRPSDLEKGNVRPDHVIDGIGQLPDLLQRMSGPKHL
jgi:HAD superfamily hydrolase (TIGR01458 family)